MIERCQYQTFILSFPGRCTIRRFVKMPRVYTSIFDDYFEIKPLEKQAVCKTCDRILRNNTFGMRKHMLTHDILVPSKKRNLDEENVSEEEPVKVSPSKKSRTEEVEPIEDQVCRETAQFGASFK